MKQFIHLQNMIPVWKSCLWGFQNEYEARKATQFCIWICSSCSALKQGYIWTSSNRKKQLVDTVEPFPSKFKEEKALHQAHNKVKYEINLEYFVDEGLLMDPPQIPRHQRWQRSSKMARSFQQSHYDPWSQFKHLDRKFSFYWLLSEDVCIYLWLK